MRNLIKFTLNLFNLIWNSKKKGSSSSKSESELEIGDEILEINGENVCDYEDMPDLIEFIHNVSHNFICSKFKDIEKKILFLCLAFLFQMCVYTN